MRLQCATANLVLGVTYARHHCLQSYLQELRVTPQTLHGVLATVASAAHDLHGVIRNKLANYFSIRDYCMLRPKNAKRGEPGAAKSFTASELMRFSTLGPTSRATL